ncbi:hypothetical protein [Maricaulis sp. CAU 1757]
MTVRVELIENDRFIEVIATGQVTRREAGWATERTRELSEAHDILGVLADCSQSDGAGSAALTHEYIENFLLAFDRRKVVAYVRSPVARPHEDRRLLAALADSRVEARTFGQRQSALVWLSETVAARS